MKLSAARPSVSIFDADAPSALAFERSLGRAGVPTRLWAPCRWPLARFSRYSARFSRCPDPEDAPVFLPWLRAQLEAREIELIAPTSDLLAFYAAELEDAFQPHLLPSVASACAVRTALFKDRFDDACGRAGFRTPRTLCPTSVEHACDLAPTLRYPVVIKPRSHVVAGEARGELAHNAQALRRSYRRYPALPAKAPILARYPELALPLIQEYVPRTLENLYSISGLLGPDGAPLAVAASRKRSQWPPALGIGIEFESCADSALLRTGVRLTQAVLGRGLFELELIWDERVHDWLAIDLNPRAHGFISFDIARNNDLPLRWYQQAVGQPQPCQEAPRSDLTWIHSVPFHLSQWIDLVRGPQRSERLLRYGNGLLAQRVDIVNDWEDPLPTALFLALMLRHPGGLIRPLLDAEPSALA